VTYNVLRFLARISSANNANIISDDLTILQVNRTGGKPCVLRKMSGKLDVRRNPIVTLALSQDIRAIVIRCFYRKKSGT